MMRDTETRLVYLEKLFVGCRFGTPEKVPGSLRKTIYYISDKEFYNESPYAKLLPSPPFTSKDY